MKRLSTVIKCAAAITLLAWMSLGWGAPQEHRPPLSQGEVYDLLSNSVPSAKIVADIRRYGIAFTPTDAEIDQFRRAGADNAVLEALRHGRRQEISHPLSAVGIRTLLATDVSSDEILRAVNERGIDFRPSPDYLEQIQSEGASDKLMDGLSRMTPRGFSMDEIVQLLVSRTDQRQLAQRLTLRGIEFEAKSENLTALRIAGAQAPLLEAVSKARVVASSPSIAATSPNVRPWTVALVCGSGDRDVPVVSDPDHPNDVSMCLACGIEVTVLEKGASDSGYQKIQYADGKVGFAANRFVRPEVAKVGGDVLPPKPFYMPEPPYTREARRHNLQGTVTLWIVVDAQGNVTDIQEVSQKLGDGLDPNAIDSVRTWKFHPSTRNGVPVAVRVSVEVSFRLYDDGAGTGQ